jgi:hypothetical protein
VVRVSATQTLAAQFPAGVRYVEVDCGHELTLPDGAAWPEISAAVMAFAAELAAQTGS